MPEPKASILETPFDPHGGPDGSGGTFLDFSVNANPFGPDPELLERLARVDVSTYPDPSCRLPVALAAARHGIGPDRVLFGNGAADLIHRLAACYLAPGSSVVVASPSFGEYARASSLYGARVHGVPVYEGAAPDEGLLSERILALKPTLVWLCAPNNPTGHAWDERQLGAVAGACEKVDALLVLDAAYLELSEHPGLELPEGALVLHSLTKLFAVPGVRLGYALGPAEVIRALARSSPPWGVSAHAQEAACWALSQAGSAFAARTVPTLLEGRDAFRAALRDAGLSVRETATTFFLVEVADAPCFKREAARAGFRVRDCSSFGLGNCVRLATRLPSENARLLEWLAC